MSSLFNDESFTSDPQQGDFTHVGNNERHRTDLTLKSRSSRITGEDDNGIGANVVHGRYCAVSKECHRTNVCIGRYDIFYRGSPKRKSFRQLWLTS
jgi:hypothetical protein